tara:strand:- start:49 stop:174 length:126 start_codon:yes stop_codon:yes gene_type:complete
LVRHAPRKRAERDLALTAVSDADGLTVPVVIRVKDGLRVSA